MTFSLTDPFTIVNQRVIAGFAESGLLAVSESPSESPSSVQSPVNRGCVTASTASPRLARCSQHDREPGGGTRPASMRMSRRGPEPQPKFRTLEPAQLFGHPSWPSLLAKLERLARRSEERRVGTECR